LWLGRRFVVSARGHYTRERHGVSTRLRWWRRLFLEGRPPGVVWRRLYSTSVHRLIDRGRHGRVRHGLHAADVLVLRMGSLQRRVMRVGCRDGRLIDLLVGGLCRSSLCRVLSSGIVTRRVPGYTSLSIVRSRVVVSGRVARIEGRADGRQLGGVGRVLWRVRVLMRMVQVLVERQGRWCVWRMVLVWLACLCRRSVVSCWRRFPLVPWRLSFSSRMLVPIIDGPPQDRIAKHDDSAYGGLETAEWLLHGHPAAGTDCGARRERGGDGRGNAP